MLLEMTMGGNPAVQSNLAHYILHLDRDNKLAWHIKGRLSHTLNCIRDRKERCEVTFTNISPVLRREYKNGMQTFNMLQQVLTEYILSHIYSLFAIHPLFFIVVCFLNPLSLIVV